MRFTRTWIVPIAQPLRCAYMRSVMAVHAARRPSIRPTTSPRQPAISTLSSKRERWTTILHKLPEVLTHVVLSDFVNARVLHTCPRSKSFVEVRNVVPLIQDAARD